MLINILLLIATFNLVLLLNFLSRPKGLRIITDLFTPGFLVSHLVLSYTFIAPLVDPVWTCFWFVVGFLFLMLCLSAICYVSNKFEKIEFLVAVTPFLNLFLIMLLISHQETSFYLFSGRFLTIFKDIPVYIIPFPGAFFSLAFNVLNIFLSLLLISHLNNKFFRKFLGFLISVLIFTLCLITYLLIRKFFINFSIDEIRTLLEPILNIFHTTDGDSHFPFLKKAILLNCICQISIYLLIYLFFYFYRLIFKNKCMVVDYSSIYLAVNVAYSITLIFFIKKNTYIFDFIYLHGVYCFGSSLEILIHNYLLSLLLTFTILYILLTVMLFLVPLNFCLKVVFSLIKESLLFLFLFTFNDLFVVVLIGIYSYNIREISSYLLTFFVNEFRFFGFLYPDASCMDKREQKALEESLRKNSEKNTLFNWFTTKVFTGYRTTFGERCPNISRPPSIPKELFERHSEAQYRLGVQSGTSSLLPSGSVTAEIYGLTVKSSIVASRVKAEVLVVLQENLPVSDSAFPSCTPQLEAYESCVRALGANDGITAFTTNPTVEIALHFAENPPQADVLRSIQMSDLTPAVYDSAERLNSCLKFHQKPK